MSWTLLICAITAGVALLAASAPAAQAGSAVGSGGTLTFTGAPGEVNVVDLHGNENSSGSYTVSVTDTEQNPSGGGSCGFSPTGPVDTVVCTNITDIQVNLGDRADTVTAGGTPRLVVDAGSGDDTLHGTEADDVMSGGDGDDTLAGGPGDDTLFGNGGDDVFVAHVDGGADDYNGGAHSDGDLVDYAGRSAVSATIDGLANDGYPGESDDVDVEHLSGGPQADTLVGDGDDNELAGGAGADTLEGGAGADTIDGEGGDDVLRGGADADKVVGGDGDDLIDESSFSASDVLDGGAGTGDTVSYAGRTAPVTTEIDGGPVSGELGEMDAVQSTVEGLVGGDGADVLTGDGGANVLAGGPGSNVLQGGAGDDRFDQGTAPGGADTMEGGAGDDTADYSERTSNVWVDPNTPGQDGGGDANADGVADEDDDVRGDVEILEAGLRFSHLTAGPGTRRLVGHGTYTTFFYAGPDANGPDEFVGSSTGGASVDYSDRAADEAVSASGDGEANDGAAGETDRIGDDIDTLRGSQGDDTLIAGDSVDPGTSELDRIWGEDGDDTITGGPRSDTLRGDEGDDVLDAGAGSANTVIGGVGDDLFIDGGAPNGPTAFTAGGPLNQGDGNDTVSYRNRTAPVVADIAPDANADADDGEAGEQDDIPDTVENVIGGSGDDRLGGDDGANALQGRGGDDHLDDGTGPDQLNGGAGTDRVDYATRDSALTITIDDVADDGEAGENDNVMRDVEDVRGGAAGDTMTGSDADERLEGNGGADDLTGGAGADDLRGGDGDDRLHAADGGADSRLDCGPGADDLLSDHDAGIDPASVGCERGASEGVDSDADGVGDGRDTCPSAANPDQADADGDGIGDVCDPTPDPPPPAPPRDSDSGSGSSSGSDAGPGPAPPTAPAPVPAPAPTLGAARGGPALSQDAAKHPAKITVRRAGVRNGRLDVLAEITKRAAGSVAVSYRSSGRTTRFSARIADGRIRVDRRLPSAQRRKTTGIVTLTYAGNDRVRRDEVRLRAANGKARLTREVTKIEDGRLQVSGSISERARGVVRLRLEYVDGGKLVLGTYRAPIRDGAWSLDEKLPAAAARTGGQVSIQFTGYEQRRMRGEQAAKQVRP